MQQGIGLFIKIKAVVFWLRKQVTAFMSIAIQFESLAPFPLPFSS